MMMFLQHRVSKMINGRLILALASLGLLSGFVQAHEVSATNVKAVVVEDRIEIQQTIAVSTASDLSKALMTDAPVGSISDETILTAMQTGWSVVSDAGLCSLARQAYKRVHHDEHIVLRYLYTCPSGASPSELRLPWLAKIPAQDMLIFELTKNGDTQTKTFSRQNLTINLD